VFKLPNYLNIKHYRYDKILNFIRLRNLNDNNIILKLILIIVTSTNILAKNRNYNRVILLKCKYMRMFITILSQIQKTPPFFHVLGNRAAKKMILKNL
jgi:hypothetical protein